MSRLIDCSHVLEAGMITYRGLPVPIICDYLSREESRAHYAPGTEFHIGKIEMVANNGTVNHAYFEGHPYLTEAAARYLVAAGATFVGIDSLNIDDTADGHRPVHSHLLRAGIPIVEHLCNLEAVPDSGGRFFAVPVKVRRFGTFPVRAFVSVE